MTSKNQARSYMLSVIDDYTDPHTGLINTTQLAEDTARS